MLDPVVIVLLGLVTIIALLALRAGLLYLGIGSKAAYWRQERERPIGTDELVLVALGDSTVQGVGARTPQESFVGQLAMQIQQQTEQPVRIVNLGQTGATTWDVLGEQIPKLKDFSPDCVLLAVGPNDINKGVTRQDFEANYLKILTQLPADRSVIADIPPMLARPNSKTAVNDWNEFIHAALQKRGIALAEVNQTIGAVVKDLRIYAGDIFHPSSYGYSLWAKAFWPGVEKIFAKKPPLE